VSFCLQNLRPTQSFPMALSQNQKDLRVFGFLLAFSKSGRTCSSSSQGSAGGEGVDHPP
jgi:hypothetical protein